jgi:hypothetical protein
MLGYRGHFATESRRYSTTMRALRDARRDWHGRQHPLAQPYWDKTVISETGWNGPLNRGLHEARAHLPEGHEPVRTGLRQHAAWCPQRQRGGLVLREIKERRLKVIPVPPELATILREHRQAQVLERALAGRDLDGAGFSCSASRMVSRSIRGMTGRNGRTFSRAPGWSTGAAPMWPGQPRPVVT